MYKPESKIQIGHMLKVLGLGFLYLQSTKAKLAAHVWLVITPFKKRLGLKVGGVLKSSGH